MKTLKRTAKMISKIELEMNFEAWLQATGNRNHGHAEKSVAAYLMDLRLFIAWCEDHYQEPFAPAAITRKDFSDYFDYSIHIQRAAAATWNRRRASLALFVRFCLDEGYIIYDPFQGVPVMERAEVAPRSLTKLQLYALIRKADQAVQQALSETHRRLAIRNRAMIYAMAYAGLREGELAALHPSDLLLRDRSGQIMIIDGKRHKQATISIGNQVVDALREWMLIHPATQMVFEMTTRQIQRVVREYGKMINIELTPHMLRHTYVYLVREETGDMQMAMVMARHKRIDQTMRYALPHQEDLAAVAELITH